MSLSLIMCSPVSNGWVYGIKVDWISCIKDVIFINQLKKNNINQIIKLKIILCFSRHFFWIFWTAEISTESFTVKSKTIQMTFVHFARRQIYKSEVSMNSDKRFLCLISLVDIKTFLTLYIRINKQSISFPSYVF